MEIDLALSPCCARYAIKQHAEYSDTGKGFNPAILQNSIYFAFADLYVAKVDSANPCPKYT